MPRLKERLMNEIDNNGLSIRNGDDDGFILYETGNNRHFVYIYNNEIDEIIKLLHKKQKDLLQICNATLITDTSGNSAQARKNNVMQKSNKNISDKEA